MNWPAIVAASIALWATTFGLAYARRPFGGSARAYALAFLACVGATMLVFLIVYEPKPSEQMVDGLEAKLAGRPCIGPLKRWVRDYSFAFGKDGHVDRRIIHFSFHPASGWAHPPGRRIMSLHEGGIDDSHSITAHGTYDVAADRATVEYCGPNYPYEQG
jgi:hypothetical protein